MKIPGGCVRFGLFASFLIVVVGQGLADEQRPLLLPCPDAELNDAHQDSFGPAYSSQSEPNFLVDPPAPEYPTNKPTCKLYTSGGHSLKEDEEGQGRAGFQCQRMHGRRKGLLRNVYRITGEYGVLIINCSAPFPLDLDYNGILPTEAVKTDYWKNVLVLNETEATDSMDSGEFNWRNEKDEAPKGTNIVTESYGLVVKIWSISALFQKYRELLNTGLDNHRLINRNISAPIVYSRTGGFTIRNMGQEDFYYVQDFYFFFEEPLMTHKFTWLTSGLQSLPLILTEESEKRLEVLLPCRPSHYVTTGRTSGLNHSEGSVTLSITHGTDPDDTVGMHLESAAIFDPRLGFLIDASNLTQEWVKENLRSFDFTCQYWIDNVTAVSWQPDWNYTSEFDVGGTWKKNNPNGFTVTNLVATQDKKEFTNWGLYSRLSCSLNGRAKSSNAQFLSLGVRRTVHLKFGRKFLLPMYSNSSYWLQRGRMSNSSLDNSLVIDQESLSGIFLCTDGRSYKMAEYVAGLDKKIVTHEVRPESGGSETAPYKAKNDDTNILIELEQPKGPRTAFYTANNFTFSCLIGLDLVLPVLWFARRQNGSTHLVFEDKHPTNGLSQANLQLTSDTLKIFCTASFFASRSWQQAIYPLHIIRNMSCVNEERFADFDVKDLVSGIENAYSVKSKVVDRHF